MSTTERATADPRTWRVPPAVVIGLDGITGLQSARLLADRGVPVVGVVGDRRHWGARTNACVEVVESAPSGERLVEDLRRLGRRLPRSVLLPCTDPAVSTLSRFRADLPEQLVLPLAPHPVVETLMDKVSFARHAADAGLPVPRTEVLLDRAGAEAAAATLRFPCVLKPHTKSTSWLRHTKAKAFSVTDADELLTTYDSVAGWAPALLAQEWVPGPETGLFSCNAYFDPDSEPLVTFVARKLRQWPPDVGTSASGEECRNDEVLATTVELFRSVGFHGLAYLEMKRDARTGRLMIIEPNVGRPTGRSAIAEAGGVELLHTAYCDAARLPLPQAREQRYVGARWIDLRRDLQAAAVARRRGALTVRDWVRWARGPKAHAIWSRQDPIPFAADLVQATAKGGRMLTSRGKPAATPGTTGPPVRSIPHRRGGEDPRL